MIFLLLGAGSGLSSASEIDIAQIAGMIGSQSLTTINDFLRALPESVRSRPVLLYESHSLQDAEPLHPRVVLSSDDASLLAAFNGSPTQRGYDQVELIQFVPSEARFHFYVLQEGQGALKLSEEVFCQACHQGDLRPNWQPYSHWPGAYGSDDDLVQGPLTPAEEPGHLVEFLKVAARSPRYAALPDLQKSFSRYGSHYRATSNLALTLRLMQLGFQRAARVLMESPEYPRIKYAILGSAVCLDFGSFLPEDAPKVSWSSFAEESVEHPSPFLYLLNLAKIDRLSITLQAPNVPSQPFRGDFMGTGGSPGLEFAGALLDRDAELREYSRVIDRHYAGGYTARVADLPNCIGLAVKSRLLIRDPSLKLER